MARRHLDETTAWEYEVSRGTYGTPDIHRTVRRLEITVGVRAVAK